MAQEWIYETDRWLLGYCCLSLAIGALVLSAFDGKELLAISIPTLLPLAFILSLYYPCLCNDDIKSKHAHNRHNRGGGGHVR